MRQVTPAEVPAQIARAAEQVESYFLARGVLSWSLGNIQTRYKGREQTVALREAHHIAAADAYFAARPEQDLPLGRKAFEAGHARGFDSPDKIEPPVAEIVEATSADLVQAVRAADHVPLTVHDFTDAALLKLAFCCLGGRTVRLKLLNGRAITVRLEE